MSQCHCVFPTSSEEELVTIHGDEPGRAWRVFVEASREGYVRVQELAHNGEIGWYVQKTVVLPRDVIAALVPQLRKALCLMGPAKDSAKAQAAGDAVSYMRIADEAA